MEKVWSFYEFKGRDSRRGAITEWLASEDQRIGDEVRDTLEYLEVTREWRRPAFDSYDDGLSEIRCKSNPLKREIRIYGDFGPRRYCFTMLVGSTKKGLAKKHNPRNAVQTARDRKKLVKGDQDLAEPFET